MPSFETPPDWWVSLANLTKWLYWPAVSAVLSFGALLKTIDIASRSDRDRRAREVSLIKAMLYCVGTGASLVRDAVQAITDDPQNYVQILQRHAQGPVMDNLVKALDQVKIHEVPATRAIDIYVAAWASMKMWQNDLTEAISLDHAGALTHLTAVRDRSYSYSKQLGELVIDLGGDASKNDDVFVRGWIEEAGQRHRIHSFAVISSWIGSSFKKLSIKSAD